ncbi:MASE1 domain-containing protein [Geothrix sp. 21YS21S-2]|uniref:MASE1 domain-containing protein n=1 Tax=Geothrix sp. 21YS21S-2 TaxID=3068893 RepID=UPI0027B962C1|nr:MASE1 domain-containing protein [Geothrix sp. 21YS21S-2]
MKPHWHFPWKRLPVRHLAGLAAAYFVLAALGLALAVPGSNATAVWIPTGLAIAACLRYGPGIWSAVLLGAFLANALVLARLGLPPVNLVAASLATALGNAAEALLAGYLIERFTGTRHPFNRVAHVLQFILGGAVVATFASALVGTLAFCSATGRWHLFQAVGASWWLGDAAGALVLTPMLLTFRRRQLAALPRKVHRDALLAAGLILVFWFGVCPFLPPLAFFFFPLLVLSTSRLGPFHASALVALLALLATTSTVLGAGPFLLPGPLNGSLLLQQGFICTLAITTLVLGSALQERERLEDRLRLQNRLYRTLSEVNQAIVHSEDRPTLLREASRLLVEMGGFQMAWLGFKDEATGCLVPGASFGHLGGLALPDNETLAGQAVVFPACLNDPAFAPWRARALTLGYQAQCAFPILQAGKAVGALMACYGEPDLLGTEEGRLLGELAGDMGYALAAMETRMDLAESERRFRATLETVKLVAVSLDAQATITFCNDHLLQLTGRSREEVLGRNWFDMFVPPEDRPRVEAALDASMNKGEIQVHNENEILTRGGGRRLIRWNNTVLRDRAGAIIGTIGLGEDITDQKLAEAALLRRAAQLAAMNELGNRLTMTLDVAACSQAALLGTLSATGSDLAALYLQEGAELRLLDSVRAPAGAARDEEGDLRVDALGPMDGRAVYVEDAAADPRFGAPGVVSFAILPLRKAGQDIGRLVLGSGRPRAYGAEATFLETLAGQVSTGLQNALLHERLKAHAAGLERSVEERTALLREANEDLALAVERAQAADRAKSAFLSAMSHELRTPLNSVIGFTGVLLGGMAGPLQAQQEEPLRIVQRNGRHLLDLINDVLDLSKIEASEMRLAAQPYDLVQTLRESMETLAPAAASKGLDLLRDAFPEALPMTGDRRRVSQIFLNLLSNAVKFTDTGRVTVRIRLREARVDVEVQDTGPGIAAQDLHRLFREFEQLDEGLARRNEGTGLGLALSRRLARLMNGDILAESEAGRGATFTLSLPL